MVTISGPGSVPRDGVGPSFLIEADEPAFVALEVADAPVLLSPGGRPGGAAAAGFYGSWTEGPLRPAGTFTLPTTEWESLRTANRLWFRALSSRRPDDWVEVSASVPDGRIEQAPDIAVLDVARPRGIAAEELQQVWLAAIVDPDVLATSRMQDASAAVIRHIATPRRPASPGNVSWLVCVGAPTTTGVREVVTRLPHGDLVPVGTDVGDFPRSAVAAFDLAGLDPGDGELVERIEARGDLLELVGPVISWQELSPPPADGLGGTVLVSALTSRLLFAATTSWQGGRVLTQ